MKIAVISDLHGNREAVEKVYEKINFFDKIICLGDLAMAGGEPNFVIDFIKNLNQKGLIDVIQGNTDEKLSKFSENFNSFLEKNAPVMANAYKADFEILTEENRDYLKNLPKQKEYELFGKKILCVHGSPRRNDENIFPNMPVEEIDKIIEGVEADIIFCGHTHIPCGYAASNGKIVVNAGSVGRPFWDKPVGCYAILNIDENKMEVEHEFINYDVNKASEKLRQRGYEGSEILADMLLKATSKFPEKQ